MPADAALPDRPRVAFGDTDRWLLGEGTHDRLHEVLGCQLHAGGAMFRVWAPNAERVTLVGDHNRWDPAADELTPVGAGVWEIDLPAARPRMRYRYHLERNGWSADKTDPVGFLAETPPGTASVVWDLDHRWGDGEWMATRGERQRHDAPISVYELHIGSWRGPTRYRMLAEPLTGWLLRQGYTHVELLPVMEHPFYGSWGYQATGYFAATSRYGDPQDLMHLIDHLHRHGIGVILDWVPSHFPMDGHGLFQFDGTHLYESGDRRIGYHPDWGSAIFDYARPQVRAFLRSSAHFWVERYHVDGLRVDAVTSMLYRDFSRQEGEWVPNVHGGREHLEAIDFLRDLNRSLYRRHPGIQTYAEESAAWPQVSGPTDTGGLGFGFKWDMGWMNDTLRYVARGPAERPRHHGELTFRSMYAGEERFLLPLSHDEVVHGKGSLLAKQPGDGWQRFAGLRLLLGHQWTTPGKKLLFMGGDLAVPAEWDHDTGLPWGLLDEEPHRGVAAWVADLNACYRREPALHAGDDRPAWFRWVRPDDSATATIAFVRFADGGRPVLVVSNFLPEVCPRYRLGVPTGDRWDVVLDSDAPVYGGSGLLGGAAFDAEDVAADGMEVSIVLDVPPLATVVLAPATGEATR